MVKKWMLIEGKKRIAGWFRDERRPWLEVFLESHGGLFLVETFV